MFNLYNFVAYQLAWFAVCSRRGARHAMGGRGLRGAVAALHLALRRDPTELHLIGSAAAIGLLVDSALVRGQVRSHRPAERPRALLDAEPVDRVRDHAESFAALADEPTVGGALAGAIGGPLAYLAGAKLGALTLATPTPALILIAGLWAVRWVLSLLRRASGAASRRVPA